MKSEEHEMTVRRVRRSLDRCRGHWRSVEYVPMTASVELHLRTADSATLGWAPGGAGDQEGTQFHQDDIFVNEKTQFNRIEVDVFRSNVILSFTRNG